MTQIMEVKRTIKNALDVMKIRDKTFIQYSYTTKYNFVIRT